MISISIIIIVSVVVIIVIYNALEKKDLQKNYSRSNLKTEWHTIKKTGQRVCTFSYKVWEKNKLKSYYRFYDSTSIICDEEFNTNYIIEGSHFLGQDVLYDKKPFNLMTLEYTRTFIIEPIVAVKSIEKVADTFVNNDGGIVINYYDNNVREAIEEIIKKQSELESSLKEIVENLYTYKPNDKKSLEGFCINFGSSAVATVIVELIKQAIAGL